MKKFIFSALLIFFISSVFGQQIYQLSQRHSDILEFNPSICGSKLYSEIKLHHRSQWVGFEGAPQTQIISFDGTLGKNAGLGIFVINDKINISNQLTGSLNYSYHLSFEKFNLSMGLGFSLIRNKLNGTELNLFNSEDNFIPDQIVKSKLTPQASAGLFAYNKNFYLGFSFVNIIKTELYADYSSIVPSTQIFYMMGAYNFEISSLSKLIPNFVINKSLIEKLNTEVGLKYEYSEKFFTGLSYRHKNSIVASAGVFILKHLAIAYSYDYLISDISNYSFGSHEIVLYFQIPYSKKKTSRLFEFDDKEKNELFLKW